VGLTSNEIECLGEWANKKNNAAVRDRLLENPVVKVSRRDVPFVIAHVIEYILIALMIFMSVYLHVT